ncbi:(Fe-S)-binding protein [bacterium]|nr:(Fe-S)-binding protein [candidate division CSSED10-310 bacterium]
MRFSEFHDIEALESELYTCTMCGFCKQVCPVFVDEGWDTAAPRGRMTLAYGLLSGQLDVDDSVLDRLYQCTQCHDCARKCPSRAACPDVVLAGRREMVNRGHITTRQATLVDNVHRTGNIFGDPEAGVPSRQGTLPVFIGCQYISRPNSVKKIIRLLETLGVDPLVMDESCCGFPLRILGFDEAEKEQQLRLREQFPMDDREILTLCPSCLKQLREVYGQSSMHILQMLDRTLDTIPVMTPVQTRVTYHDPCDLSRGAGIMDEPRRLLAHMGADIVEMKHHHDTSRCCGGGGGILTWDEALSLRMSVSRIEEARRTGAEMLVTACPTCEQNLKRGAQAEAEASGHPAMPVRHIMDLLIRAVR